MLSEIRKKKLEANIWKFYIIAFVSSLWFSAAIFILYYQAFGLSYFQISIIEMAIALFAIGLEVPSGAFADLVGRKWSIFLGLAGLGGGMLAFGISGSFEGFLIASVVIAFGGAFISGADMAFIYDTLKGLGRESEFLKIRGKVVLVFYSAITIASVAGGYLFSLNIRMPYYLSTVTFTLAALFTLSLQEPYQIKKMYNVKRQIRQIKEGFSQLIHHDRLIWLTLTAIALGMFISFFHNILAQPYVKSLGFPVSQLGIVFGLVFMITGFAMWKAHKIEKLLGEKRAFYILFLAQAALFIMMAFISLKIAVIFLLMQYLMWEFSDLIIQQYMHEHIKSSHRATVVSIQNMFRGMIVVVSFMAFGKLTDIYSMKAVFILSGIGVLVLGLALLHVRYSRRIWTKLE